MGPGRYTWRRARAVWRLWPGRAGALAGRAAGRPGRSSTCPLARKSSRARRPATAARAGPAALSGGHLAGVYACSLAGKECVLRITPPNEEMTARSVLATLAWLEHAAARGGAVTVPVRSAGGRLIEELAGTGGPTWSPGGCGPGAGPPRDSHRGLERYGDRCLGRAVGRLHALAAEYRPADASLRRPEWTEVGNCFPRCRSVAVMRRSARVAGLLARLEGVAARARRIRPDPHRPAPGQRMRRPA